MAHNQGLDSTAIADIYRRYGDQFYNSGDHEGAMDQYIKTIGEVQPSYVIRKVEQLSPSTSYKMLTVILCASTLTRNESNVLWNTFKNFTLGA
jgi:hypothetical protein